MGNYLRGGQPASIGTAVLSRRSISGSGMLTTHSHAVERLKVSGAVLVLTRYNFLAWTGSTVTGQQRFSRATSKTHVSCRRPRTLPSVQRVCNVFSFRFRLRT